MFQAKSYAEITEVAERAIQAAAEQVGAKVNDVRGFYLAGDRWDADTAEELTDLIVQCWEEMEPEAG
jgi:hypothetical protein